MTNISQMKFVKDLPNKKITVTRYFNASPEQVWRAWTESELLDQWWAPKPWKAETKTMDFSEGGHWLYAMVGPNGERHWATISFTKIETGKRFEVMNNFCDEEGNINQDFPSMIWKNDFHAKDAGTEVIVEITFDKESDLEKILEMGFEMGFTAALTNLDDYFATFK